MTRLWLVACLLLSSLTPALAESTIPDRPEQLQFDELSFEVPSPEAYRHVLSNGVPVYVAEDNSLPLVDVSISLRVGSFLDPEDRSGLASLTGLMLRQGGTERMTAEEFDEQVDFLATGINTSTQNTSSAASLNCIKPVLDEGLALFFELLRTPRFQEDRLAIQKENLLESMKQRNDDAQSILSREWSWLMFGEDHFSARQGTKVQLEGIDRQAMIDFHRRYWRPENMIISVSGAIQTDDILAKLESYLADWPGEGEAVAWPPPKPSTKTAPGLYHVEKDIPQGKVQIGHLVPQITDWTDPDMAALRVMNHILGGSGFTSRILQRIRSDEGLAYRAGTSFQLSPYWDAPFLVFYQSKSPTVALAAKIALEEIRRIQTELVTPKELELAKNAIIEGFPSRFDSPRQVVGTFSFDEYIGRPWGYWSQWRERVEKVDAEAVRRVAKTYLKPEELVFLVVGKWDDIAPGDADQRASMAEFYGGEVKHLPLRDPMTLTPLP